MKKLLLPISLGLALAASASAQVTINEVRIDQPGGDNDEFIEFVGVAGTSLDGLTYIVIGDASGDGAGGGIEAVIDLTGNTVPASGFFLVGETSMTIAVPDLIASLNFENSDNVTHMLVSDFTGSAGDDVDADDDGVMDFTPWTAVVDRVVLVESPGSGDLFYGMPQVGPSGNFVPGHVSMMAGTWVISDFTLGYGDTPGAANDHPSTGTPFCAPAVDNSLGRGAGLQGYTGSGTGSGVHLQCQNGPSGEIGYYLVGNMASDPGVVISNGNFCLIGTPGSSFFRYHGPTVDPAAQSLSTFDVDGILQNNMGTSAVGAGFDVPGFLPTVPIMPIMAGDTWHFQVWFRDTPAGVGTSNFSNGLSVTF